MLFLVLLTIGLAFVGLGGLMRSKSFSVGMDEESSVSFFLGAGGQLLSAFGYVILIAALFSIFI